MKVNGQWVPCVRNSSYSFMPIHLNFTCIMGMVWRYACGLDIILGLFFVIFFHNLNLVIFSGILVDG